MTLPPEQALRDEITTRLREIAARLREHEQSIADEREQLRRAVVDARRAGLTQDEVAAAAGLSQQRVTQLEREAGLPPRIRPRRK